MTDTACATCGHAREQHARRHAHRRFECWDCIKLDRTPPCMAYTSEEPECGHTFINYCVICNPSRELGPPVPVRGPDEATTDHDQWSESGRSLFCPNERVWTNRDDDDSSCMACGADVPAHSPLVIKAADHENDWTATITPVRGRDTTRGEAEAAWALYAGLGDDDEFTRAHMKESFIAGYNRGREDRG